MLVLFNYNLMNIPNLNLAQEFAAFLDMVFNTKAIAVGTPSPSVFVYPVMLHYGNTFLSLLYQCFVNHPTSPLHSPLTLPSHWTHSNLMTHRLLLWFHHLLSLSLFQSLLLPHHLPLLTSLIKINHLFLGV